MIKDETYIYNNTQELSIGFTQFLINEVIKDKSSVNIALSGGGTPKAIFDYWASQLKDEIPWEKIKFFWGDERCVPPDDEMSNYGMTKKHLFDHITIPTENIFRIQGENEPSYEAKRYSEVLKQQSGDINKTPELDLIILGLGDDGHTASIFPHEIDLWNSDEDCVVAKHPETGMKRISFSGKVINNANKVIFLVTGENKAQKVKSIIKNRKDFGSKYPGAKVNPKDHILYWFMDEKAASLI